MRFDVIELDAGNLITTRRYRGSLRGRNGAAQEDPAFAGEPDTVLLAAQTGRTMQYEIALPARAGRKATREILYHELSDLLPVDPESVRWFYRHDDGNRFQVCAVHCSEIERVLRTAAEHSLKFDRLIPAALAETPEKALRTAAPEPLPAEFRPVRFRKWKAAYLVMLALLIAILAPLAWGKYRRFSGEYQLLNSRREMLAAGLRKQRGDYAVLSAGKTQLDEIRNAGIGWARVAPLLGTLSERLPASMWITHFAVNGQTADLTVSSAEDDANLYKTIGDSDFHSIVSLKKNRGGDNRILFSVKLKGKQIE